MPKVEKRDVLRIKYRKIKQKTIDQFYSYCYIYITQLQCAIGTRSSEFSWGAGGSTGSNGRYAPASVESVEANIPYDIGLIEYQSGLYLVFLFSGKAALLSDC